MPGGNVKPDPLDVLWIEMSMRQLTNHALGLYLASSGNMDCVRDSIRDMHLALTHCGPPIDPHLQCPPGYTPCMGNPRACCPKIERDAL